jgi:hypothetical protein
MAARSASSDSGIHPLVFRKARRVLREHDIVNTLFESATYQWLSRSVDILFDRIVENAK